MALELTDAMKHELEMYDFSHAGLAGAVVWEEPEEPKGYAFECFHSMAECYEEREALIANHEDLNMNNVVVVNFWKVFR